MPGDDDHRDQWPQRTPLSATRPSNRWDVRREDTGVAQQGLDALSARKRLALVGLAFAALLVIVGVLAVETQLASRPQASGGSGAKTQATPTATATLAPTATPTFNPTPVNLSALGWFKRTPSWAERIATAPSAPNTVYACGGTNIGTSWVISFGISADGGRTWTSAATSLQAAHCYDLVVSPTAPQAAAISTDTCPSDCGQSLHQVFYTLDAGKHWSPISSTCSCNQPPDDGVSLGWVGTTLFAVPGTTSPPRATNQYLAKSTDGGAFTWLNLGAPPGSIFTTANTVYVIYTSDIYTSANLGASWTKISPTYQSGPVAPLAMAPGAALLGIDARWLNPTPNTYPLLRSADGGATWQALPDLPSAMQINANIFETPDGTVYLTATSNGASPGQGGIYKLGPGASQWKLVSAVTPGDLRMMAVSWDTNGHPATVWGLTQAHPGTSSDQTLLWSHAA